MWAGRSDNLPTGTVNGSIVTMWNLCDGTELNTYTYRSLHKIISDTYGGTAYNAGVTDQPDATTTFTLPNLKNQFVIGSDSDAGTTIETRPAGLDTDVNGYNPSSASRKGGYKDNMLISHEHVIKTDEGTHDHSVDTALSGELSMTGDAATDGAHDHGDGGDLNTGNGLGNHNHGHNLAVNQQGSTHGHTVNSPSPVMAIQTGSETVDEAGKTKAQVIDQVSAQAQQISITGGEHGHGISGNIDQQDLTHSHKYVIAEDTGHTHTVSVTGADHDHSVTIEAQGPHNHNVFRTSVKNTTGNLEDRTLEEGTDEIGEHTASLTGEDQNLPPFYALYYIMRVL